MRSGEAFREKTDLTDILVQTQVRNPVNTENVEKV